MKAPFRGFCSNSKPKTWFRRVRSPCSHMVLMMVRILRSTQPMDVTIFRGYFHVKPFGNVNEQFRIGNSADDTINCVAEPHVGVVDAEAPKQVAGFSFVFHDDSSRYL